MHQTTVTIKSNSISYPIYTGNNLLPRINQLIDLSHYSQILFFYDLNVDYYKNSLINKLNIDKTKIHQLSFTATEQNKSMAQILQIIDYLSKHNFDRQGLIINVGGGITTDVGAFAAHLYQRGMKFINFPTTILAMVDASVGGKTGVNYQKLKNYIGAYDQPQAVMIDLSTLKTLPDEIQQSGYAEVLKHGLIADAKYWQLVTKQPVTQLSMTKLSQIIDQSCQIKARVVEQDEHECGLRKILNFGHTIGHALETMSQQHTTPLNHGQAVALGMIVESKISQLMGHLSTTDIQHIIDKITKADLPKTYPIPDPTLLMKLMMKDKKNSHQQIKWTLLRKIGQAVYDQSVEPEIVLQALSIINPKD